MAGSAAGEYLVELRMTCPRERDALLPPFGSALWHCARPLALGDDVVRRGRLCHSSGAGGGEAWTKKLEDGVVALNALAGHARPGLATVSAAQRSALTQLARRYSYRPEDGGDLDPLRAWSTLQAQRPGYADCVADGAKASYQPGRVFLGGPGCVHLTDTLPPP